MNLVFALFCGHANSRFWIFLILIKCCMLLEFLRGATLPVPDEDCPTCVCGAVVMRVMAIGGLLPFTPFAKLTETVRPPGLFCGVCCA